MRNLLSENAIRGTRGSCAQLSARAASAPSLTGVEIRFRPQPRRQFADLLLEQTHVPSVFVAEIKVR